MTFIPPVRYGKLAAALTLSLICLALTAAAAHAAPNKPVFAELSVGDSPPAGVTSATSPQAGVTIPGYELTLTNTTKTQMLGSANVTKPAGFGVADVIIDRGSAFLNGDVIEMRTLNVAPGGTVTVTMTLQAPCNLPSQPAARWVVLPKQSNDYNGTGNDLTPVGGTLGMSIDLNSPCALRFGAKPADSAKPAIRSGRYDPSSDPVTVEAVDGRADTLAQPMPWFDGETITLASQPTGTLRGNTATTTDGVASFPSLEIGTAGFYKLVASTTALGFPSDPRNTSPQFYVVDQVTACAVTGCVVQRKNADYTVDAGTAAAQLTFSEAVKPEPTCKGYSPPGGTTWYDFLLTEERATTVFMKFFKEDLKNWKGGANALQVCFAAPVSGLGSVFDYFGDGTNQGTVGLLPDCPLIRSDPCVTSRGPFGSGGAFIEFWVPARLSDPRYH